MHTITTVSKETHNIVNKTNQNKISLTENSVVVITRSKDDVAKIIRNGNSAEIFFKNGDVIVIENYFNDENNLDNSIIFEDDSGVLYWAEFTNVNGQVTEVISYSLLEEIEPLLYDDFVGGILPWIAGGAATIGGIAIAGNSENNNDKPILNPVIKNPIVNKNNSEGISGTGEPDSTVIIKDQDGNTVTTIVNPDGTWVIEPNPLTEGEVGSIEAVDNNGNTSGQQPITGGDQTIPNQVVITKNNEESLSGTAEPNSKVTVTDPTTGEVLDETTTGADGKWNISPNPVAQGETAEVIVTDPAGNSSHPITIIGGNDSLKAADNLVIEAEAAHQAAEDLITDAATDGFVTAEEQQAIQNAVDAATAAEQAAQAAVTGLAAGADQEALQDRLDNLTDLEVPPVTSLDDIEALVAAAEAAEAAAEAALSQAQSDNLINPTEVAALEQALAAAQQAKTDAQAAVDALPAAVDSTDLQTRLDALDGIQIPALNDANSNDVDDAVDTQVAAAEALVAAAEAAEAAAEAALSQAQSDNLINPTEVAALEQALAAAQQAKTDAQAAVDALPAAVQTAIDAFQERLDGLTDIVVPPVSDTTPPVITDLVATPNPNGTATITGKTEQGAIVVLKDANNQVIPVTVNPDGSFIATVPAPATQGSYSVSATDAAGNEGTATTTLVDDVPPQNITVDITRITDDTGINTSDFITLDKTLTVSGTISRNLEAGEKVQISHDGTTWYDAVTTGTAWTVVDPTNLTAQNYTYRARVVDNAGNAAANTDSQAVRVVDLLANADLGSLQANVIPVQKATNLADFRVDDLSLYDGWISGGNNAVAATQSFTVAPGNIAEIDLVFDGTLFTVNAITSITLGLVIQKQNADGTWLDIQNKADFGTAGSIFGGIGNYADGEWLDISLGQGTYRFVIYGKADLGFTNSSVSGTFDFSGLDYDYGQVTTTGNVISSNDIHSGTVTLSKIASEVNTAGVTLTGTSTTITGQHGTLTISSNGSYSYTRFTDGDNYGQQHIGKTDTFTYTITDQWGHTSSNVLNIQIGATGLTFNPANPSADATATVVAVNDTATTKVAVTTSMAHPSYNGTAVDGFIKSNDSTVDTGLIDWQGNGTGSRSQTIGTILTSTDVNYSEFIVNGNSILTMSYTSSLAFGASAYVTVEKQIGVVWTTVQTGPTFTSNYTTSNPGKIALFNPDAAGVSYRLVLNVSGAGASSTSLIDFSGSSDKRMDANAIQYNNVTMTKNSITGNILTNDTGATFYSDVKTVNGTQIAATGNTTIESEHGKLTINAAGAYTYNPSKIDRQDLGKTDVFNYTVTTKDGGVSSAATLSVVLDSNGVIMSGSNSGNVTLTGTNVSYPTSSSGTYVSGDDIFVSRGSNDTINGGTGHDTLIYNLLNSTSATGGNGSDSWNGFNVNKATSSGIETDLIDIRGLLSDQTGLTDTTIKNILSSVVNNGNTVISIDRDGAGSTYSSTTLLTLNSVNTTLDELLANKQILY